MGAGLNFVAEDICGFILETGNYYSLYFNGRLSIKNCSVFITFVIIYIKMLQVVLLYSNWKLRLLNKSRIFLYMDAICYMKSDLNLIKNRHEPIV